MTKHEQLMNELGLELPEEIIQHIHSFLERKPAAQTSLLSKSWYKAWSTRPNLLFYHHDFRNMHGDFHKGKFCDYVSTTFQRYLDLNINVNKLVFAARVASLADMLIDGAVELRVNVLQLYFWDICYLVQSPYILPAQVFANKYLTELCLSYCKIDYLIPGNVLCSNLRSLNLSSVYIDDSTFKDILARCPVIEHLKLCLMGLTRLNASELLNIKTLIFNYVWGSTAITLSGRFLNLSRLVLNSLGVADSFFLNFSSTFPKLEDLTLEYLKGDPDIQISSHSITVLTLKHNGMLKMAKFDVPNIRNFEFNGDHIPPLSFTASSKEWNSEISLANSDRLDLSKLRDFLIKFGRSKITLHLHVGKSDRNVAPNRYIENLELPLVEKLILSVELCKHYNFVVECLLCCRPKLASLSFRSDFGISIRFMYKKLIERRNQNGFSTSAQYSSSLCMNELEEVDVEIFEESLKQWQPIKPSYVLKSLNHKADKLRFKLKWGSLTPEYTIIKLLEDDDDSNRVRFAVYESGYA